MDGWTLTMLLSFNRCLMAVARPSLKSPHRISDRVCTIDLTGHLCSTNYVWYKRSKKLVQLYTQLILEKENKDGVFFAYVNTLESQRHGLMRPRLLGIHQYNVFTYELSTDMEHAIYFRLVPHLWFFTKWRDWPLSAQMPINQLVACIAMA